MAAIHGTVKVRLLADLGPSIASLVLIDDPRIEVRVNRELFAG